jgi:hypothetical protein
MTLQDDFNRSYQRCTIARGSGEQEIVDTGISYRVPKGIIEQLLFARHAHSDEEASIESLSQESDQRKERERGLRALKSQQDSASKAFHGAVADHIAGLKNS